MGVFHLADMDGALFRGIPGVPQSRSGGLGPSWQSYMGRVAYYVLALRLSRFRNFLKRLPREIAVADVNRNVAETDDADQALFFIEDR